MLLAAAILDSLKVAYFRMNAEILKKFQVHTPGPNLCRPDKAEMQIFIEIHITTAAMLYLQKCQ